ncbi:hypothetical protein JQ580_22250 [Bradyrhizobium japonicum]|uniref:DUF6321 domain-containing protein n=1 Tax=Bradyrhizobium japonicum TaxID=375 RepID=UPI001BAB4228|nr:DUF6321 domain-containing protein [Bradyrhizobium japonicum]MBR0993447.1 hypothetical protein [Bradyrhizobium japonicum]
MAKTSRAPWKRSNPRKRAGKASKHLSPAQKSAAKARARRAGRRYPNLVDNMRMVAKKTTKKASKKKTSKSKASKSSKTKSARKTAKKARKRTAKKKARSSRKRSASVREKDPRGGLTAAGRKAFARKQGAHLRPGVTKTESEMTPQEMRRKGSWAVRFYGRAKLPPLVDAKGRPTRHALSAHAWGEPVPKTVAAARRIAAKGERLLARYRRAKAKA